MGETGIDQVSPLPTKPEQAPGRVFQAYNPVDSRKKLAKNIIKTALVATGLAALWGAVSPSSDFKASDNDIMHVPTITEPGLIDKSYLDPENPVVNIPPTEQKP